MKISIEMIKSIMCLGKSRFMWLDSRVEMYVGGGGVGKRETYE